MLDPSPKKRRKGRNLCEHQRRHAESITQDLSMSSKMGDKDGEEAAASSTKRMPDQRAGGSEGPVGVAWWWAPLYFDEKGKACRCVGEWCECASVPAE